MNKLIFFLLIAASGQAYAQNCTSDFLGTKALYKKTVTQLHVAPAGYQPVFINYVGRHGARHLTKDVSTYYAYKLLMQADSAHALTVDGIKLKQAVVTLNKVEKGNIKSISEEGKAELRGIGERLYAENAAIFKGKLLFRIRETKEIRTKQSADAFLAGLKSKLRDSVKIDESIDDINLRFFDAAPAYKQFEQNGEYSVDIEMLDEAVNLEKINDDFCAKIFTKQYLKSLNAENRNQLVSDVFGFATIAYSVMDEAAQKGFKPADIDFKPFFTCDQILGLSKLDVADDYYKKGPGVNLNGIQVRIAAPLLADFINSADAFVEGSGMNADLRFAHAETIIPIAALMDISVANKPTKDIRQVDKVWRSALVAPLSSNIQWIFYKKRGSNNYLVKILLNEKEAKITGLPVSGFPYYNWSALREFYMKKLQKLNVTLDSDMKAYLQKVK
jgi:hypothetical protein